MSTWMQKRSRTNESWSTVTPTHNETLTPSSLYGLGEDQAQESRIQVSMAQHKQLSVPEFNSGGGGRVEQKRAVEEYEIEPKGSTSSSASASWVQRVRLMGSRRERGTDSPCPDSLTYQGAEAVYYGGAMDTEFSQQPHPARGASPAVFSDRPVVRNPSYATQSSKSRTDDSLADFDESEWTPPDSSYGAAIPVGGWIPKQIRRMIEWTLIALGVVGLVYLIVTTSIRVTDESGRKTNGANSGANNYDGGTGLNDNAYSDYGNDNYDDLVSRSSWYNHDDIYYSYYNSGAHNKYYSNDDEQSSGYNSYNGYNSNNKKYSNDDHTDDYYQY